MLTIPLSRLRICVKVGDEHRGLWSCASTIGEGVVTLSKKRLDAMQELGRRSRLPRTRRPLSRASVTEENKGGVVVNVKGIRVFVPASQTGLRRNEPMSQLREDQTVQSAASPRSTVPAAAWSAPSAPSPPRSARLPPLRRSGTSIEVGKHYTGTVKSLTSYGAFVDIGGVDGMVHISELSWSRIKHPSEVVICGRYQIEVYVIKV